MDPVKWKAEPTKLWSNSHCRKYDPRFDMRYSRRDSFYIKDTFPVLDIIATCHILIL